MRIRQNRRLTPHRLQQIQQLPKKPNRPLPKPPQDDTQLQLPNRNLPKAKRKRLRHPSRRKIGLPQITHHPKPQILFFQSLTYHQ